MASFAIEDFVGNGCLQGLVPMLLEEGWDDVPTLKIMNVDDMNELNMTKRQKVLILNSVFLYISREYHLCWQLSDSCVSLRKKKTISKNIIIRIKLQQKKQVLCKK